MPPGVGEQSKHPRGDDRRRPSLRDEAPDGLLAGLAAREDLGTTLYERALEQCVVVDVSLDV